jgi:hypothetical protein
MSAMVADGITMGVYNSGNFLKKVVWKNYWVKNNY